MSTAADVKIRNRIKELRDDTARLRDQYAEAKKDRDAAKEAFSKKDDLAENTKIFEIKEFKDAEMAVRKVGEIEDAIEANREAERSMLGLISERDSGGNDGGRYRNVDVGQLAERLQRGWNGRALLEESEGFKEALDGRVFHSTNRFGTINMGEIVDREGFLAAALPAAPAGNIGTDQGAVVPDVRGIVTPRLKSLSFLDIIPTGTTDSNIVQYVQVTAIPMSAAETAEFVAKPQSGITLGDATAPVRTIAGWVKLARQAMDDVAGLVTMINTLLPYDVRRRMEAQMLAGDGTGQNLLGILSTSGIGAPASAAGDNIADGILRAMTTVVLSDSDPNFVTLNPLTWQSIATLKAAGSGEYMFADPGGAMAFYSSPTIWGLRVTQNRIIPQATPLVGDAMGATLLVREGVNVKASDSDQDDFIKNRVTILAEARVAFPVWRPSAFAKAPLG